MSVSAKQRPLPSSQQLTVEEYSVYITDSVHRVSKVPVPLEPMALSIRRRFSKRCIAILLKLTPSIVLTLIYIML